ncbi:MAG: aurora-like kinase [Trebouxia sp. A1-2]|nr:MAG: aurora-like kinase [Trebouxia sp. A1-2]
MGLFSILKDKAGQGPDHSELAELDDHSVASRAKSEFAPKRQAHFTEAPIYRPANDSPKIAALYKAGPSKSFTANTTALSHLHLAAESSDSTIGAQITPEDVEYTSNAQFQNRVELYRGSISTVYKALCSTSKDTVIIKAYEKAKMKTKNFLRMEREIKLMRCLVGEGLAQLYGVFEDQTHKTLVMEYCKGGDLFKLLLLKGGSLDEHWVCIEIIVPLLRVLVLMHEQHILHRDIKPENIFLTGKHKLKLGDLGLAIRSNEELPFTRSGTLDYMAPEVMSLLLDMRSHGGDMLYKELVTEGMAMMQVLANPTADIQEGPKVTKAELKARGVRPYDEKVDVWATGILAYELVVGRPPFEVNDEVQTATMIMFSNNISYPPKHSALWADFVKVALEKKPHIRPTALQMLDHPW